MQDVLALFGRDVNPDPNDEEAIMAAAAAFRMSIAIDALINVGGAISALSGR